MFRVGSKIFPWNSEYALHDLPDYDAIVAALHRAGQLALQNGVRLTAHPDHFVKLASLKPDVVQNSVHDLEHHHAVFTLMGLPDTKHYCLNIHVGMNRSPDVSERFLHTVDTLSDGVRKRLVVENDDKDNGYSVQDLYRMLPIDIPITFDYFHHQFHTSGVPERDAAWIARSTWGNHIPLFHYSESKVANEQFTGNPRAHADYILNKINPHDLGIDIDVEAKAKEDAVLQYRQTYPESDYFSIPNHEFTR